MRTRDLSHERNASRWSAKLGALLLIGSLASCAPTSPQREIAAGQRRCVIYHPYYYNGDKRSNEVEIRNALTVQLSGGEKYTLRPYRSLQVPIPRSGTVVEVMSSILAYSPHGRLTESAKIPAGGETAYVRVSRSQEIGRGGRMFDRAKRVDPDVAKKELAEFE